MSSSNFGSGGAFVLGGSGGIGSAICEAFARSGVPVSLSYFKDVAAAERTSSALKQLGAEAHIFQTNAGDRESVAKTLDAASSAMGGLHSIVYAAGPEVTLNHFCDTPESVWRDWLLNDLLGAINLGHAAIPHLRKTKGAFTSLSTYQAKKVEPLGGPSAVSKAGVDRLVQLIAREEGSNGVRANSVQCGWIGVELVERMFELMPEVRESKKKAIPLGRVAYPEEVVETVVFLSSKQAGFITGVNLMVDGGESL